LNTPFPIYFHIFEDFPDKLNPMIIHFDLLSANQKTPLPMFSNRVSAGILATLFLGGMQASTNLPT